MQFDGFRLCEGFLGDLKQQSKFHKSAEADLRRFLEVLQANADWAPFGAKFGIVRGFAVWKFRIGISSSNIGKSKGFRLMLAVRSGEMWLQVPYTHAEYPSQPPMIEILKRLPN